MVDHPQRFQKWSESWRTNHPNWEYRLWTDADNRAFVANHYPWFLSTFDSLPRNIHRADAVRYLYLHKYGGVYADLDVESLKNLDNLFVDSVACTPTEKDNTTLTSYDDCVHGKTSTAVLAWMSGDHYWYEHNIPNAWMASTKPGHSFWMFMVHQIMEKLRNNVGAGVEDVTGPVMLYKTYKYYEDNVAASQRERVVVLEPGVIFPFRWINPPQDQERVCNGQSPDLNESECKRILNATGEPDQKAYTITYWSHTWDGENKVVDQWGRRRRRV
ncbi:hypothetical protein HK102_005258 [Quaeritorhiza haematococci]|nr:hypothetical protein HK102_005258 [Quaeritorhiza haematococci]